MKCECYHDDINYIGYRGVCWGTKEKDPCKCGGDKGKCDFYPDVRKEHMSDSEKLSFLTGELRTLCLIIERSIDALEGLNKSSLSKDSYVILSRGMIEAYREVEEYIKSILKEIE